MTTSVLSVRETVADETSPEVLELGDTAEALIRGALAQARAKLSPREHGLDTGVLFDRPGFLGHMMSGLALGTAATLAKNDRRVRAVYTYDPTLNADSEDGQAPPLDLTLHLIVVVESRSAALEAFIDALDRALIENLKNIGSPFFAQRSSCLDRSIITDRDIRLGSGAAGLLSAVFTPPIKIWECEA